MSTPFLQCKGIKRAFPGVQALKGVDLEVSRGEVLSLIGPNGAGKSTLMNILGGVLSPDEGDIRIDGEEVQISSPIVAQEHGIAFVHQEMALLPTLTVAENMFVAGFPRTRLGTIDYKRVREEAGAALSRLTDTIDPWTRLEALSAGDQQMVEIARALLTEPDLIIFDEATSSLTGRERDRLFEVIQRLKSEGVAVIYITHLLGEVFELCDRAVVLRNGETSGSGVVRDLSYDDIVHMMIGEKEIGKYFASHTSRVGEPLLRASHITRSRVLSDISFELRAGEVVGLWGLLGSGRTELVRAVVGLDPVDSGQLQMGKGDGLKTVSPREVHNSVGLITENRRDDGLLLPMSVANNMTIANLKKMMKRWPWIDQKRERMAVLESVKRLGVKISNIDQTVGTLSGGNQQKVVVARWLLRQPDVFLMDEPTRGLDVEAKTEIHRIIGELAKNGSALLVISSDIDEIMSLSDRYLVMSEGTVVASYSHSATKVDLMSAAAGGAQAVGQREGVRI